MITTKQSDFLLSSKSASLLLHVNEIGKLTTEYFGAKIPSLAETDPLVRKYPYAPGGLPCYDEAHQNLSLDAIKGDWSTPWKSDYHNPSLLLSNGKTTVFDFVYDSFVVRKPEPIDGLPTPHGAKEELVIKVTEKLLHVSLFLHYFVYEEENVLGRYLEIVNEAEAPLTIEKAMSYQLVLVNREDRIETLYGSWAHECNLDETLLPHGVFSFGSDTGLSSARHNPFFLIKEKGTNRFEGKAYGFNLVYSGSHLESIERDNWDNLTIQSGISPLGFKKSLAKGASFKTPMGVFTFSEKGVSGVADQFHAFVNDCVIPPFWKSRPRPIVCNNWEATYFKFDKRQLVALMKKAKTLGIETFVLDDGWFGERNDDSHGLGDWTCNTKKIPGGLASLSKKAKSYGLSFGIWMEPEMVNEKSRLYEKHPEWIIQDGIHVPSQGRHQFMLNLAKKEVQEFVYQSVHDVLKSAEITYLKWDCNRSFTDVPGDFSSFSFDYTQGLYAVLSRLSKDFPEVLFENCASGGSRYDLGMLSYFPQSWMSDDTDSFERLHIQENASLGYPQSTFSNHVAAKTSNQMLRYTTFDTKFDVASFGVLGYEFNLNDLAPLEEEAIKKQIAFYKKHRPCFQFGRYVVLSSIEEDPVAQWEVLSGEEEALVGHFQGIATPNPKEEHLFLKGLDEKALYRYEARRESLPLKKFGSLINFVSPVHLKEDSPLLMSVSKHKEMTSEKDEGTVSGSALLSGGVVLAQEWSSVGYDERIRLIGDFGARIYLVEKK